MRPLPTHEASLVRMALIEYLDHRLNGANLETDEAVQQASEVYVQRRYADHDDSFKRHKAGSVANATKKVLALIGTTLYTE